MWLNGLFLGTVLDRSGPGRVNLNFLVNLCQGTMRYEYKYFKVLIKMIFEFEPAQPRIDSYMSGYLDSDFNLAQTILLFRRSKI